MNRRTLYLVFCLAVLTVTITLNGITHAGEEPSAEEAGYLLKEYDGKLAVFLNGEETPFRLLDGSTAFLPENDKEALEEGIFIPDEESLKKRIEDFTS